MKNNSSIINLSNTIKEHSQTSSITGAIIGAILVIYYCGSINFYPSGLTIADTLFFLWTVVVFGFYYSVIALIFFIASTFWVYTFSKPINFIFDKINRKNDIIVPFPKSDFFMVLIGGFFANIPILATSYFKGYSFIAIFLALFSIGFIYILIENMSKPKNSSEKLLDSNGKPINPNLANLQAVKKFFYIVIYLTPLIFGEIGSDILHTTFEKMGIRQKGVTIHIKAKEYKSILNDYKDEGLISESKCREVCTVKNVNILFTSIGTNTKLEVHGKNGSLLLVLPTKALKLTVQVETKKPVT